MTAPLTREQAAIIGAYTGFTCGPFPDLHEYAEKVLCRPILSHEFGTDEMEVTLRCAAGRDFLSLYARPGDGLPDVAAVLGGEA